MFVSFFIFPIFRAFRLLNFFVCHRLFEFSDFCVFLDVVEFRIFRFLWIFGFSRIPEFFDVLIFDFFSWSSFFFNFRIFVSFLVLLIFSSPGVGHLSKTYHSQKLIVSCAEVVRFDTLRLGWTPSEHKFF